jgi:hypothetical protein
VLEAADRDMKGRLAVDPAGELVIDEQEALVVVLVVGSTEAVIGGPGVEQPRAVGGVVPT